MPCFLSVRRRLALLSLAVRFPTVSPVPDPVTNKVHRLPPHYSLPWPASDPAQNSTLSTSSSTESSFPRLWPPSLINAGSVSGQISHAARGMETDRVTGKVISHRKLSPQSFRFSAAGDLMGKISCCWNSQGRLHGGGSFWESLD